MALSGRDYGKILEIIDVIYSIPEKSAMFQAFCGHLQKFIGIYSAVSNFTDPAAADFFSTNYQLFHNREATILSYITHYSRLDPFVTSGWFTKGPTNIVARNTDLMPTLAKSEFGCDFLIRQASIFYVLASRLSCQGDVVGPFGIHRQKHQGDFTRRHMEIVNALLPHLARALHNLDLIKECAPGNEQNGVIALGSDGKPFYLNNAARTALGRLPVARIPEPGLGPSPAYLRNGTGEYRVRTVPMSRGWKGKFILLERAPERRKLNARLERFKLSRREHDVAALVIQGHSNGEIAEQLFICEQTVKDHLHNIFEKLAIRRRSELIAKVLGLYPSAN